MFQFNAACIDKSNLYSAALQYFEVEKNKRDGNSIRKILERFVSGHEWEACVRRRYVALSVPELTPWAKICRPFRAWNGVVFWLPRAHTLG